MKLTMSRGRARGGMWDGEEKIFYLVVILCVL